jgi:hypothetical protein
MMQNEDSEELPIRGIKLNHPGRKLVLGRSKCPATSSSGFANHLQAIQAVQQQHVAEQLLRNQQQLLLQQQLGAAAAVKKVHPLQRQFIRSRSAFIRPVR